MPSWPRASIMPASVQVLLESLSGQRAVRMQGNSAKYLVSLRGGRADAGGFRLPSGEPTGPPQLPPPVLWVLDFP